MRPDESLAALVSPRSVAVIGASDRPSSMGGQVARNLIDFFAGSFYLVNPRKSELFGRASYPTICDLPETADMAVIVVNAAVTPEVVRECAVAGCKVLVIISSGFAEVGGNGVRLQQEISEIAHSARMRVLGPNCFGIANLHEGLRATYATVTDPEVEEVLGDVAIVSQSGSIGMYLRRLLARAGVSAPIVVTTGNESDITVAQALSQIVEREDVRVLLTYMEAIRDVDRLDTLARRAAELGKPIVALKVGASDIGAETAKSHTGALRAGDKVVAARFDELAIVRAGTCSEAVDLVKGLSSGRVPRGRRVFAGTPSGGIAVMAADGAAASGLQLTQPSESLSKTIYPNIPDFVKPQNPLDWTAHVHRDTSKMQSILAGVDTSGEYDAYFIAGVNLQTAEAYASCYDSTELPMLFWSSHDAVALTRAGLPCFDEPTAPMGVLAAMAEYGEARSRLQAIVQAQQGAPAPAGIRCQEGKGKLLTPSEALGLLERYGLPVVEGIVISKEEDAVQAAKQLGVPVALKLSIGQLQHRTDENALRLNLSSDAEIRGAFTELHSIAARFGITSGQVDVQVQRMVPAGIELFFGARHAPVFGLVVSVGIGGRLVEVLGEWEMCFPPISATEARRTLAKLCEGRLVTNRRGLSPAAMDELVRSLIRFGEVMRSEHVLEADANPVIVSGDAVHLVDALIVTMDS